MYQRHIAHGEMLPRRSGYHRWLMMSGRMPASPACSHRNSAYFNGIGLKPQDPSSGSPDVGEIEHSYTYLNGIELKSQLPLAWMGYDPNNLD